MAEKNTKIERNRAWNAEEAKKRDLDKKKEQEKARI